MQMKGRGSVRVIGLTGGIACGKSNVSDALGQLGAVIVDGDRLSRQLTAEGGAALPEIRKAFGAEVFTQGGKLDRKALARAIFADSGARERLDGIMQPMILELIRTEMEHAQKCGAQVCVLDMPLLYEKRLDLLCDTVWCVALPEETQLSRLMARDGLSVEEARQRMASQLPAAEKARRADVVIDTSGSVEETRAKIPPLYRWECRLAERDGEQDAAVGR